MHIAIVAVLAYLLDLVFGDPYWMWHPICAIGNLVSYLRKWAKKAGKGEKGRELFFGGVLVAITLVVSTMTAVLVLLVANAIHPAVGFVVEVIIAYQRFAAKSLKTESMKVYDALAKNDIEGGRTAVSMIVGRDTASLTEEGIIKAAVETVAENSSDGVVAPLFYLILFGVPGMVCYKAINTMDSMVGYKNETYLYLGRAAAKLDDMANYIPARLSGLYLITASFLLGYDGKNAWKMFVRDRYNHASPNSAQTESAMAGALGVGLAGDAYYFGTLYKKKTIGDAKQPIQFGHIKDANRMLYGMSFLAVVSMAAVRVLVWAW